jgi:hypothetical protein
MGQAPMRGEVAGQRGAGQSAGQRCGALLDSEALQDQTLRQERARPQIGRGLRQRLEIDMRGQVGLAERYGERVNVRDFDGNPRRVSEMDALIAYMQMLGTLVDFSEFEPVASGR